MTIALCCLVTGVVGFGFGSLVTAFCLGSRSELTIGSEVRGARRSGRLPVASDKVGRPDLGLGGHVY